MPFGYTFDLPDTIRPGSAAFLPSPVGRDAADVPITHSLGQKRAGGLQVVTDERNDESHFPGPFRTLTGSGVRF